jgi:adenylate cyclase
MATEKASLRALELLNEAIERDPLFAPAHALSAFCHLQLHASGRARDAEQRRSDCIQSARTALRITNDDPLVLGLAAYTLGGAGKDIVEALELIERSLQMNPSSAESWRWSGWLRLWSGDPDLAISHFEKALRLHPRDGHPGILMGIGVCHFFSRRFQEAIELLNRSLQLHASWVPTFRFLAASYWHLGQIEDARNAIRQLKNLTDIIIPPVDHWCKPEHQELLLSGLRPLLCRSD